VNFLNAVHDDILPFVQALIDDPALVDLTGRLKALLDHLVVRADDKDEFALFILLHCGDRNQDAFFCGRGLDDDAHILPRQEKILRVRETGINRNRAGCRIDLVADERKLSGLIVNRAVAEFDFRQEFLGQLVTAQVVRRF
jgi:hypothetical protein